MLKGVRGFDRLKRTDAGRKAPVTGIPMCGGTMGLFGDVFFLLFGLMTIVGNEYISAKAERMYGKWTKTKKSTYQWQFMIGGVLFTLYGFVSLVHDIKNR